MREFLEIKFHNLSKNQLRVGALTDAASRLCEAQKSYRCAAGVASLPRGLLRSSSPGRVASAAPPAAAPRAVMSLRARFDYLSENAKKWGTIVWRRGGRVAWVVAATSIVVLLPLLMEIEREGQVIETDKRCAARTTDGRAGFGRRRGEWSAAGWAWSLLWLMPRDRGDTARAAGTPQGPRGRREGRDDTARAAATP